MVQVRFWRAEGQISCLRPFCSRKTWARAPRCGGAFRGHRRLRGHPGCRPGVRPCRVSGADQPLSRARRTSCSGRAFVGSEPHRVLYFWHSLGNRLLTLLSNMFTNLNLTRHGDLLQGLPPRCASGLTVEENRFGFEPEITAKIAEAAAAASTKSASVQGAHLQRRQEDWLARRSARHLVHAQVFHHRAGRSL